MVWGREASAGQPAKTYSMILTLLLLSRRHAGPLTTPTTKSTCSSNITARKLRISFTLFGKIVVDMERYHREGFLAAERLSSEGSTRYDTLYHPAQFSFNHRVWLDAPDIVKVYSIASCKVTMCNFPAMCLSMAPFSSASGSWIPVVDAEPFLYR